MEKLIFISLLLLQLVQSTAWAQQNGERSFQIEARLLAERESQAKFKPNQAQVANQVNDLKVQYVNVNGLPVLVQFTYTGLPKILPIATADSYPEGSLINLICTVSGGERRNLKLSWKINNEHLNEEQLISGKSLKRKHLENLSIGADDADISILKIRNATQANSGQYTCLARNALGEDSTSVKITIDVELKWAKLPRDSIEVGLNQELLLECDAIGSPEPTIDWLKHTTDSELRSNGTQIVARGKQLKISKTQHGDSGLYECSARNKVHRDLRKVVQVKVRGE